MQFGDPSRFAIRCVHEPILNETARVFGRMCIIVGGQQLGDFNEPACMLNVTEGHLQAVLRRLSNLFDPAFDELADVALYRLLSRALYESDERTSEQVAADAERYFKFDFLTNGGESFDRFRSFICLSKGRVKILFADASDVPIVANVEAEYFAETVAAFLSWLSAEGEASCGTRPS